MNNPASLCGEELSAAGSRPLRRVDVSSAMEGPLRLPFRAHARIMEIPAWIEALGQGRAAPRSARFSLDAVLVRPILAVPGMDL